MIGILVGLAIGLFIVMRKAPWTDGFLELSPESSKRIRWIADSSDSQHILCLKCVDAFYLDTGLAEGNIATNNGFMTLMARTAVRCGICGSVVQQGDRMVPFGNTWGETPAWEVWSDWPEVSKKVEARYGARITS